jgi:Phage ABA sandwich domain
VWHRMTLAEPFDPRTVKAGRDLDALIHRRFLGKDDLPKSFPLDSPPGRFRLPAYSYEIADAWLVVDKLREMGFLVTVKDMPEGYPFVAGNDAAVDAKLHVRAICELYFVRRFDSEQTRPVLSRKFWHAPTTMGDTPAEAICRAALCVLELDDSGGV